MPWSNNSQLRKVYDTFYVVVLKIWIPSDKFIHNFYSSTAYNNKYVIVLPIIIFIIIFRYCNNRIVLKNKYYTYKMLNNS